MTSPVSRIWFAGKVWYRTALENAQQVKEGPAVPSWLALLVVLIDFFLVWLCWRWCRDLSIRGYALAGVLLYLFRLGIVSLALFAACRFFRVSWQSLGLRRATVVADIRWALRLCLIGAAVATVVLVSIFFVATGLGILLPRPPELFVQVVARGNGPGELILIASMAVVLIGVLAPVTEELIYRSLLLPILTRLTGLIPAVIVTSILFGMLHVLPFGEAGIPLPQIAGGLVMATVFAVRWSVAPAIVVHALGNLFVATAIFLYVRIYEGWPALFAGGG